LRGVFPSTITASAISADASTISCLARVQSISSCFATVVASVRFGSASVCGAASIL
jgi:hypothetical protein